MFYNILEMCRFCSR